MRQDSWATLLLENNFKNSIIFLQLKTHLKKIIIELIYRLPVHNISRDTKLYV